MAFFHQLELLKYLLPFQIIFQLAYQDEREDKKKDQEKEKVVKIKQMRREKVKTVINNQ